MGRGNAPAAPPPPLPHPTMGCHDLGACGGQAQPSERFALMGDKVRWLHGQPRAAKKPQWEQVQGVAGMPQECHGWVKGPQGRPQARQEQAQVATELQETWAVAQPLEAKVRGVAKPPPWVAEPP